MLGDVETRTYTVEPSLPPSRLQARPLEGVFAPGEVLADRFRVIRLLGQGGMGQVFEAFDQEIGAAVALKVIRPENARSPEAIRLFKNEVHLARQVTHPNVCRIFDLFVHTSGQDWGNRRQPVLFLTMELLEGPSLSAHLRTAGPLSIAEALPLLRDMAEALDASHRQGIVHQDFKSSNVMLVGGRQRRRAIVTDFGLAGTADLPAGDLSPVRRGTPAYMAPEVKRGGQASTKADVYAFGVVAFEMLTGGLPASWDDVGARGAWAGPVRRCLDPDPQRRFHRPGEAAMAIANAAKKGRRFGKSLVGSTLLVAGALAASILPPGPAGSRATSGAPRERPATTERARAAQLYNRGVERLRLFDYAAALGLLQDAVVADPEAIRARAALARTLSAMGRHAEALETSWRAWTLAHNMPDVTRLEVEAQYRVAAREWDRAAEIYHALWERFPERTDYGLDLAAAQSEGGHAEQTFETLARLRQASSFPDPRIDMLEAATARRLSDFTRAHAAASRALREAQRQGSPEIVGRAAVLVAETLLAKGEVDRAALVTRQAERMYSEQDVETGRADVLLLDGNIHLRQRDTGKARESFERQVELSRQIGYQAGVSEGLRALGFVAMSRGQLSEADSVFTWYLRTARQNDAPQSEMIALSNLAEIRRRQGDLAAAEDFVQQGLVIARRHKFLLDETTFQLFLARISRDRGDLETASKLFQETLAEFRRFDAGAEATWVRYFQGGLLVLRGELQAARAAFEEVIGASQETGVGETLALYDLADLALEMRQPQAAVELAQDLVLKLSKRQNVVGEIRGQILLANARIELAQLGEARAAFRQARQLAGPEPEIRLRLLLGLLAARLTAVDDPAAAADEAGRLLSEAMTTDLVEWQLKASLALGEYELAAGRSAEGRQRLAALADDAAQRGYLLVARRAQRLEPPEKR